MGFRTERVDVKAQHVKPHHTLKAHPDPYDDVMTRLFKERHEGHAYLGSWERSFKPADYGEPI